MPKTQKFLAPPPFLLSSRDARIFDGIISEVGALPENISRDELLALLMRKRAEAMMKFQAQYDDEVQKTFPTMRSTGLGMSRRALYESIVESSLFNGERIRLKRLYSLLRRAVGELPDDLNEKERQAATNEIQEQVIFSVYKDKYGLGHLGLDRAREIAHRAIVNVQNDIEDLLGDFPINYRQLLQYSAAVMSARDLPTLFQLARRPRRGKGIISQRIPVEARILLGLAQLEFEHLISVRNPDHIDGIRERLIQKIENEVFDNGTSRRVVVVAELDPDNHYRVKVDNDGKHMVRWFNEDEPDAYQETNSTKFVLHLNVRAIRTNGHEVLIFFDSRRKQRIWAKQVRKLMRDVDQIADLSGFIFVILSDNQDDEEVLANRLRASIVNAPGCVKAQDSNAKRAGAIDETNPHSSKDRRGEKYEFLWEGMWHELQILTIAYYINSLISQQTDGHGLYKLSIGMDKIFPLIWPTALYGLDWKQQKIRDILWQHLIRVNQAA